MFDTIMNRKELVKKIDSIGARAKTLRGDVALAAASAWQHAAEHGDLTLMSRVHNKTPRSFQADLKRYFRAFAPVRWDQKSQQFKKLGKGGTFDPAALETMFDQVEPEAKPEPEFDQDKAIANCVKAMIRIRDNAELTGDLDTAIKFEIMIENLKPSPIKVDVAA